MFSLELSFDVEVVEQQTLLNGTRYVSIEGGSLAGAKGEDGTSWLLTLNFAQPKEAGAPLTEGDLTLSSPDGSLVAGLESGTTAMVMDGPGEDEQLRLRLSFAVTGGDGSLAEATGAVTVRGVLTAESGRLEAALALDQGPAATE